MDYVLFTDVPAVAGMEFLAVAEDLSLANDAGGSPSVNRVGKPMRAVVGAVPLMDVGSVVGRRPAGLSDSDVRRNSEEGSSPVDIVTIPELIRLLLVSRWKILGNPGIGIMVGRVMQTTEMSHLMLGPGDRSHRRILGRRSQLEPLARRLPGS